MHFYEYIKIPELIISDIRKYHIACFTIFFGIALTSISDMISLHDLRISSAPTVYVADSQHESFIVAYKKPQQLRTFAVDNFYLSQTCFYLMLILHLKKKEFHVFISFLDF